MAATNKSLNPKWHAQRKYHRAHPEMVAKCRANTLAKDPYYFKWRAILKKYGISKEAFLKRITKQKGKCPICKEPLSLEVRGSSRNQISVDHDHRCCPGPKSCGKCVCGLIHQGCNQALGVFKDSSTICRSAAAYLESTGR